MNRIVELPVPATASDIAEAKRILTAKPFDWRRDAHGDFDRRFPPIVGRGRGVPLAQAKLKRAVWRGTD